MRSRWHGAGFAWLVLTFVVSPAHGQQMRPDPCRVLVVAFVGGLGTANFPPTMATPVLRELQSAGGPEVCIKRVSTYWPWTATRWAQKQLFRNRQSGDGTGQSSIATPKIVAFGYSLGVPHVLRFARALQRQGIPIELLVTVDAKGFSKGIVPNNVKTAANYYERELYPLFYPLYYGKADLFPEDSTATNFLGNILVLHTGHFGIVTVSPVRRLILRTVQNLLVTGETSAPMLH